MTTHTETQSITPARIAHAYTHVPLGEACLDCVMAIANDDYSGMDADTEARVRGAITSFSDDGCTLAIECDEEPRFSWSRCDVCDSHLGGDRFTVAFSY